MQRQELEAEENLASMSQATSYIFEWEDKKLAKKLRQRKSKEIISQQNFQDGEQHVVSHRPVLQKQSSERYDLKKWQKKAEMFNKIQYPIVFDNLFTAQQQYILPKCKISNDIKQCNPINSISISKKQGDINRQIYKAIEEGIIKRKLQKFRQKILASQKTLISKELNSKPRPLPRSFVFKRNSKESLSSQHKERVIANQAEISTLKKIVTRNNRRYSLPHLAKISYSPPALQNPYHIAH